MADYDDLDTKRIFTVGILSIVVTAVTALAVQVVYYSLEHSQKAEKTAQSNYGRQNRILQAQSAEISEYGVDETTGNYTIPVSDAMDLMLAESSSSSASAVVEEKEIVESVTPDAPKDSAPAVKPEAEAEPDKTDASTDKTDASTDKADAATDKPATAEATDPKPGSTEAKPADKTQSGESDKKEADKTEKEKE